MKNNDDVEGEHQNSNTLVEGELNGLIANDLNDQTDEFYNVVGNVSNASAGSKVDEIFKYASLDFDPAYPPMDKWTCCHPMEHILGDPHDGVMTRAQI